MNEALSREDASLEQPSTTPGERRLRFFTPWLPALTGVWLIVYLTAFEDPGRLFLQRWPLIVAGVFGALVGNATAIGGGLVFIPLLIGVYRLDPVSALKLTFVTQAVGMTSGAAGWIRRGTVPLQALVWTVPPLVVGSAISTFVVHPNPMLVKGLFGPTSMLVGSLALILAGKQGTRDSIPRRGLPWIVAVSLFGGLLTGWVAIGEGEVVAAFLMLACGLRAPQGIGLGVVLLSINSILLALVHALHFGGVPWSMAIFTILGVLWGGRLGPYVAELVRPARLKRFFGGVAMLDGALFFGQFLLSILAKSR